mgnify:CR=1 FL=1
MVIVYTDESVERYNLPYSDAVRLTKHFNALVAQMVASGITPVIRYAFISLPD